MHLDNPSPQDLLDAGPDAIALALGVDVRNPHPLASMVARAPLSILMQAGDAKAKAGGKPTSPQNSHLTIGTWDFYSALAEGVQSVIVRRFDDAAEHRRFCGTAELKDFRFANLPVIDMADVLPPYFELGEPANDMKSNFTPLNLEVVECVRRACVVAFARRIGISRALIKNDDIGILADLVAVMGNMASRTEAFLLYRELELNPLLDDAAPVFIENENWIKSALDETSLAAGIAAMRTYKTPSGNNADIPAAFLVVAPGLEFPARKMVHQSGSPLEVISTAWLADGHWYLVSDPKIHPACSILKLRGAKHSVRVDPTKQGRTFAIDGTFLTASADLGAVVRGRMGIVRGGL